jgi:hypothetical protein
MSIYRNLFHDRSASPGKIILSGGGSQLQGFAGYISSQTSLPVTMAEALPGKLDDPESPSFVTAAGLAATGLNKGSSAISLLPANLKNELFFRGQKPFWIASAAVAALTLAISLGGGFIDLKRAQTHLAEQNRDLAERQDLGAKIERIRSKNEVVYMMAAPVKEMISSSPMIRQLMTAISNIKDDRDWITLISDDDSYFNRDNYVVRKTARTGAAASRKNDAGKPSDVLGIKTVIIEGYTRNSTLATVKNLIAELDKADFVASADLLSDDRLVSTAEGQDKTPGIRFAIEVKIKPVGK